MKVHMRVNLGSIDAKAHGLDHTKLQQGMEADVSKDAGEWLIKNGHAVEASKVVKQPEPEKTVKVEAIAPRPTVLGVPITSDDVVKADKEAAGSVDDEGDEESPLATDNATDAKDKISRMRSKERLQEIADTDTRSTVAEAARKRLEEIG